MNIDVENLDSLWYEDNSGDRFLPYKNGKILDIPDKYIYQHSQFPLQVVHSCLRKVLKEEVENCSHPKEHIHKTYGWIDGVEGRECKMCHGTQTKNIRDQWPDKWDAYGSRKLFSGTSSYSDDLVLALVRCSLKERIKSLFRGFINKNYPMDKAILIASNSCERCMNALAYQYGLDWGYPEYGFKWAKCGTSCEFCR